MKKNLFKILIGSMAFMVFLFIGYPKFMIKNESKTTQATQNKQKKNLISRNGSGHFTRTTGPYSKKREYPTSSRIIYIGESTEGLLD